MDLKIDRLSEIILSMPRSMKRWFVLTLDIFLCIITVYIAFYLRLGDFDFGYFSQIIPTLTAVTLALPIFVAAGLYRSIFRYSDIKAMFYLAIGVSIYGMIYASIFTFYGVDGVPRTIGLIQPILLFVFISGTRAIASLWLGDRIRSKKTEYKIKRALIYGAGAAGRQLASAMAGNSEIKIIGFIDDDKSISGSYINGLIIYSPLNLANVIKSKEITDVLLAIPSASASRRNQIINSLKQFKIAIRTLPGISDIASGKISVTDVRELEINDLLGREPVEPNVFLLSKDINTKTVMVTGAGGSIGGEICRQILSQHPEKILLVEQSEVSLYQIHQELEWKIKKCNYYQHTASENVLIPLLASVQDSKRIYEIISTWKPYTVYHAAAYKHVPLVEHNPGEGIKNNVIGTLKTAKASADCGVNKFVLISTDKAVRPTNIMGASKRLAEMIIQALSNLNYKTTFCIVRFGNVLGSSGSVFPKFRQQIRELKPISLTHPDITRYFMTIPEAAQLVIQAGAMAEGGDVFVLDMGKPVKIIDLAKRMVELSGLSVKDSQNPYGDIEIEITGLRPGEKLYEELLIGDNPQTTMHPRIMMANEEYIEWDTIEEKIVNLNVAVEVNDVESIRVLLQELVKGYIPHTNIVDWVHLRRELDENELKS